MCCVTVLHVLVVYWHHALWSFLQRRSLNVGGHSFTVSLSSRDRFQKTHLLPFRKTRRCQRYNNEGGRRSLVRTTKNGVQPPGIQSVLFLKPVSHLQRSLFSDQRRREIPAADQYEITKLRERAERGKRVTLRAAESWLLETSRRLRARPSSQRTSLALVFMLLFIMSQ